MPLSARHTPADGSHPLGMQWRYRKNDAWLVARTVPLVTSLSVSVKVCSRFVQFTSVEFAAHGMEPPGEVLFAAMKRGTSTRQTGFDSWSRTETSKVSRVRNEQLVATAEKPIPMRTVYTRMGKVRTPVVDSVPHGALTIVPPPPPPPPPPLLGAPKGSVTGPPAKRGADGAKVRDGLVMSLHAASSIPAIASANELLIREYIWNSGGRMRGALPLWRPPTLRQLPFLRHVAFLRTPPLAHYASRCTPAPWQRVDLPRAFVTVLARCSCVSPRYIDSRKEKRLDTLACRGVIDGAVCASDLIQAGKRSVRDGIPGKALDVSLYLIRLAQQLTLQRHPRRQRIFLLPYLERTQWRWWRRLRIAHLQRGRM